MNTQWKIPKEPQLKDYVGRPYSEYENALNKYLEANKKDNSIKPINSKNKYNKSLAISAFVFVSIICIVAFIFLHESKEDRQLRLANDKNLYITISPAVIHLDKYCIRIKNQKGYIIKSKSELYTNYLGAFCPECCTFEDIDILKNQIRNVYNH